MTNSKKSRKVDGFIKKAKRSETRKSRIEKYVQHILNGKGLNDV